jgi:hypothetical protein
MSTVLEFAYFRRSAQQAIREAFEEVRARVEEVGRTILIGLEEVTAKAGEPLQAASRTSVATLEELTRTAVAALQSSARELGVRGQNPMRDAGLGVRLDRPPCPVHRFHIAIFAKCPTASPMWWQG